jgi:GxxExxY protein
LDASFEESKPITSDLADLLVEERVLVELEAIRALDEVHLAQGLNYLMATGWLAA